MWLKDNTGNLMDDMYGSIDDVNQNLMNKALEVIMEERNLYYSSKNKE